MTGPKYTAYIKAKEARAKAQEWLDHIGKQDADMVTQGSLRLSEAHSKLELIISGRYASSGSNYHHAPAQFTAAMLDIIHESFTAMAAATMQRLATIEAQAIIDAELEVLAALNEVQTAKQVAIYGAPIEEKKG